LFHSTGLEAPKIDKLDRTYYELNGRYIGMLEEKIIRQLQAAQELDQIFTLEKNNNLMRN